ncbi:MAG: hypothetical protein WCN81_13045, partial [Actinomycetes bacterium]
PAPAPALSPTAIPPVPPLDIDALTASQAKLKALAATATARAEAAEAALAGKKRKAPDADRAASAKLVEDFLTLTGKHALSREQVDEMIDAAADSRAFKYALEAATVTCEADRTSLGLAKKALEATNAADKAAALNAGAREILQMTSPDLRAMGHWMPVDMDAAGGARARAALTTSRPDYVIGPGGDVYSTVPSGGNPYSAVDRDTLQFNAAAMAPAGKRMRPMETYVG